MPFAFSYFKVDRERLRKRREYVKRLIAKGCSPRKAEHVAWRRFR